MHKTQITYILMAKQQTFEDIWTPFLTFVKKIDMKSGESYNIMHVFHYIGFHWWSDLYFSLSLSLLIIVISLRPFPSIVLLPVQCIELLSNQISPLCCHMLKPLILSRSLSMDYFVDMSWSCWLWPLTRQGLLTGLLSLLTNVKLA